MERQMIRCYNCGGVGHKTQHCPSFGPKYPEPGKTGQDYGELSQKIANLFAADIIREHEGHDDDSDIDLDSRVSTRGGLKSSEIEEIVRTYPCTHCKAEPGRACRGSRSHKNRIDQAKNEHKLPVGLRW
jgi:hypothetical protein